MKYIGVTISNFHQKKLFKSEKSKSRLMNDIHPRTLYLFVEFMVRVGTKLRCFRVRIDWH